MAILRYTASADTTITNAFDPNLETRGTGSNMGYADSLEIFSITAKSRALMDNLKSCLAPSLNFLFPQFHHREWLAQFRLPAVSHFICECIMLNIPSLSLKTLI